MEITLQNESLFLLCREFVGSVEIDAWVCVRSNESGCIQRDVDKSTYFEDLKIKMDFVKEIICIFNFLGQLVASSSLSMEQAI